MRNQGQIHSYYLIIDRLMTKPYPTKKELLNIIKDQGIDRSLRSFERRMEELRAEYYLEMPFNYWTKNYCLTKKDKKSFNDLLRFLELHAIAQIVGDAIKFSKKAITHFSFDRDGKSKGLSILKPLLIAIETQSMINFHYNVYNEDTSEYIENFCPMVLREYLGRWYVCGAFFNSSDWFTYGLDRISDLTVTMEVFTTSIENPATLYDSVIGFNVMDPEEVELAFSSSQAKQIKGQPLHHSQELISETKDEVIFRYFVARNQELVQKILTYGQEVRVLKPEVLVNDVKNILSEALGKYK